MKKAAIITLYHKNYNFGGQLQAYALQKVVSDLGLMVEVIDYDSQNKIKKIKALSPYTIISRFYHKLQMKFHLSLKRELKNGFAKKKVLFDRFMEKIPHSKTYTNDTINTIYNSYDFWIVGSDQVWNPEAFTGASLYLLEGVCGVKMSYAASSLNARYTIEEAKLIKHCLQDFVAISARELGLTNTLSKITERSIKTVLDPTLLLKYNEWDKIAVKPDIDKKYAFVYLVHISDEVRKNIYTYCKKNNLTMIIVPHSQGWYKSADEKYYDIQALAIGPQEWIGYIKYAEIVFTDSFHGTVFSVNYHKRFLSFENLTGDEKKDVGFRKYSFLKSISLETRCVSYSYNLERDFTNVEIDYLIPDSLLEKYRLESVDYLKRALENE